MQKSFFIHFGDNQFNKFQGVDLDSCSSCPKTILVGKIFNSFNINNENILLNKVFLGWSYSILIIGKKVYRNGFQKSSNDNSAREIALEGDQIKNVSCGLKIALFLTEKGICYFFSGDQLIPSRVHFKSEELKIKDVATCDLYHIALIESGQVFSLEFSNNVSTIALPLSHPITKVACGKEHVLMLSDTGQIFNYGFGSRGQLGHGDIQNQSKPLLLEALDGVPIASIAAGGWHSAAISYSGDLYMWGWNESGQLGLPCSILHSDSLPLEQIETICSLPKYIAFKEDLKVTSVSCGSRHSAAITEDCCLWTWGWNGYGQLGHKKNMCSDKPEMVVLPKGFVPKVLRCSFWSTLISGSFNKDCI